MYALLWVYVCEYAMC